MTDWSGFNNQVVTDDIISEPVGNVNNGEGSLFQVMTLNAEYTYNLSFDYRWVSGSGNYNMNATIRDDDTPGPNGVISQVALDDTPDVWHDESFDFTVPAGVTNVRVLFYKPNGNRPFRLNNVVLEENVGQVGCLADEYGQWPSATFTPDTNLADGLTSQDITTCAFAAEYSKVSVLDGETYKFSGSISTDYYTISDEDGDSIYAAGEGAVTWVANADQVIRFWTHTDDECGADNSCRVRNVTVGIPPNCIPPLNLTTVDAGIDFLEISWNADESANDYEIIYSDAIGFDPEVDGESFVVAGTENSAIITNLSEDTAYEVYVVSQCDGGETAISNVLSTQSGITGGVCSAAIQISSLPYTTSDNTSNYGDNYNGSPGAQCGTTSSYLNGDDVVYSFTAENDGSLDISLTGLSENYAGIFVYESCADIGTACVNGASNGFSSADLGLILDLVENQEYFIVISTWAAPQSTAYTLTIEEILCSAPSNLGTSNLTLQSANFSWNASAEANQYNWAIFDAGDNPEDDDPLDQGTTSDTSVTSTLLEANTSYVFFVESDCTSEISDSVSISFTTPCETASLNYIEDFENFLNPCWQQATGAASGPSNFGTSNWSGAFSPQTGSQAARNNVYVNTTVQWLISQAIDLGAGSPNYVLSFDIAATVWNTTNETTFGEDDEIGVMISNDGGTSWIELISYSEGSTPSSTGQSESIDLSAYSGVVQFGVYAIASPSGASDHWVYFDNFFVGTPPDCLPVSNLIVSGVTTDGADLSWDAQPNAVEYTWIVFEDGDNPEDDTPVATNTTTDTSATVNGLASSTNYFVVILTDCGVDGESLLSTAVDFATLLAPTIVSVGNPFFDMYCYDNNEFIEWRFDSDDGSALVIDFEAGSVEANWDDIIIYDGVDSSGSVLFNSDVDGNVLAGLSFTAQSGSIYMTLETDSSVSCQSSENIETIEFVVFIEGDDLEPAFANVQIIHNSPDPAAALVDIYVDGELDEDLTAFSFRSSTPFMNVPANVTFQLDIVPSGQALSESVLTEMVTFDVDENYIIVANGVLDPSAFETSNAFELTVYEGARLTAADANDVDVLVHHGSPDAPAVDVNEIVAGNLVSNIAYPEFQGYLSLAEANYTLEITAAGDSEAIVLYSAPLADLELEGSAITVIASGFFGNDAGTDNEFGLWVATAAGGALIELPVITTSTIDFDSANFTYYPNPVKSSIHIEAKNVVEQVEVFNMLGQRVLMQRPKQTNPSLDMSQMESGVYMMKVSINGADKTFQIIKD